MTHVQALCEVCEIEPIITGRFGGFGGRYAPESQIEFLQGLTALFHETLCDSGFWKEYWTLFPHEPSPLNRAPRLTRLADGGQIWLKREDLSGHASNSRYHIVGQILLARRMNKTEIIMACGSTKHGVECASLCASLGMACSIFVGMKDAVEQPTNIQKIINMGSSVIEVDHGGMSLREAMGEAQRAATSRFRTAFYVSISAVGPHPYPLIVRTFQSITGSKAIHQMTENCGKLPDVVVAPVGSNGTTEGFFYPFLGFPSVRLLAVEAFGSAALCHGSQGVYSGTLTNIMQNDDGQILHAHSLSPDMNLPAVGPELAHWAQSDRIECSSATTEEAVDGLKILKDTEGFDTGLDTAHAIQKVVDIARELDNDQVVLLHVSSAENAF
ncbi:hypothetical protein N7492_008501 [Penicillium capsulatum]|uniref:tryptophan synthase n=1 Tax=Penicillium capsulatum TaxID=69766 RepID=A0A9W9LGZ9_9EURO|nr:hypothetical protein N7492_008501 [Penicillium capsulatum]KAJ6105903.1 hypothetical protein N7512_009420 [Penicillium capsulatum]